MAMTMINQVITNTTCLHALVHQVFSRFQCNIKSTLFRKLSPLNNLSKKIFTQSEVLIFIHQIHQSLTSLQIFPTLKPINSSMRQLFHHMQISSDYLHPLIEAPLISTPTSYEVESSSNVNVSFSSLTSYTIYFHGYMVLCFHCGDILLCHL